MFEFIKQPYMKLPSAQGIQTIMGQDTMSPLKLLLQIIILQFFYYITAFLLFWSVSFISGLEFTLKWVLSWELVSLSNTLGLTLISLWIFDSLLSVLFIMIIVGRSKLAWDFAITVHVINLFIVWVYSHKFPISFEWWLLQLSSCFIMVSLGTWSTRWQELRDTFFDGLNDVELGQGNHSSNSNSNNNSNPNSAAAPIESIALKELEPPITTDHNDN